MVTTSQPVDKVADFLSDFTTTAEWDPHTTSCRRLDDGPVVIGSRFENVQHIAGRDTTLTYEVTEYEPGHRIVLEGGNDTVRSRDEMIFESTADGTRVTYNVDIELRGLAKVGQPAVALGLKKVADEGAEGMRRRLAAL
jgi:carbon monoxide dehydrogenase subunit G